MARLETRQATETIAYRSLPHRKHPDSHILIGDDLWGGVLRASYDFVLGPVSIQANYSNLGKNVGFYINAGFVF